MKPYIGITDFMDIEQVREMMRVFASHRPPASRRMLHVGVMMSYKTLRGKPTTWQNAFPRNEHIAGIFAEEAVYNCLHYADTENNPELASCLTAAINHGGDGMHALQLDMSWPDPNEIARGVEASGKQIEVILQIGRRAMDEVGNDPARVVERLGRYEGVVHRVLLDRSMGKGVAMDAHALIPHARAIRERFPSIGIAAAGGLGPQTIHLVEPLIAAFPDISIDAQGRLRPSGNALDPIDWDMAADYLVKALRLFA